MIKRKHTLNKETQGKHINANIYMQSNRCKKIMCRKTQMHRSMKHKCKETHNKIYNNACKCVCALILFLSDLIAKSARPNAYSLSVFILAK